MQGPGKFLQDGFRETALGASRHLLEEEAHPRAAILRAFYFRNGRTTALCLRAASLERMKYKLGWYRGVCFVPILGRSFFVSSAAKIINNTEIRIKFFSLNKIYK